MCVSVLLGAGSVCICSMRLYIPVPILECLFSISDLLVLLDIISIVGKGIGRTGVNHFLLYQNLGGLPGGGWRFGRAWGKKPGLAGADAIAVPRGRHSHDQPQQQPLLLSRQQGLSPLRAEEPGPCGCHMQGGA